MQSSVPHIESMREETGSATFRHRPGLMMAVLYGPSVQNINTRAAVKSILTANDPGGRVTVSDTLHALSRETIKCFHCGLMGHFARNCPSRVGTQSGAGLNARSVQAEPQEHALIASLQGQVDLHHKLLITQEMLVRH